MHACSVPFGHNRQNVAELIQRHKQHPDQVADAMVPEHVSLSPNPRAALYKNRSLIQIIIETGNTAAVDAYHEMLAAPPWAVYRLRRIYTAKGKADRLLQQAAMFAGAAEPRAELIALVAALETALEESRGMSYLYREHRTDTFPTYEEFLTAAPAVVPTKARCGLEWFDAKWNQETLFPSP